jgi:hypothetical protein
MGAQGRGAVPKANLIVEYFGESPLKNIIGQNLVMPRHSDDIIKKSIPDVGLDVGKGSIALERALEDGRQCCKPIWLSHIFWILPLKI